MAISSSSSNSYSRFSLLEMQVRALVRGTTDASDKSLDRLSAGLKDPHYIHEIIVTGLFKNGTIGARLTASIDWREHSIALAAVGSRLSVPNSWSKGVSPSLNEAVRTFNLAVETASLKTEWSVRYGPEFEQQSVNRVLGFHVGEPRKWAHSPLTMGIDMGPLDELSVVIELGID